MSTQIATLLVLSPSVQAAWYVTHQVLPRSRYGFALKLTGAGKAEVNGSAALAREGTGHVHTHLCRHCSRCSTTCVC